MMNLSFSLFKIGPFIYLNATMRTMEMNQFYTEIYQHKIKAKQAPLECRKFLGLKENNAVVFV